MSRSDLNSAYNTLQAMSRDNSYAGLGNMPAHDGWTFGAGLATGRNFRNQILKEQEAARNRKRFDTNYDQLNKKHNSSSGSSQPQSQQGVFMQASPNGVYLQGRRLDTPTSNGVYVQGRNDVSLQQSPYNVTQMNTMPNLEGGRWNGRLPQSTASNNKYTFNEEDYIPSAKNGYHLNDRPQMAEWGSPQDWQMQQARNAMRDVYEGTDWYKLPYNGFGSAIQKAEQPQREVDRYPQELVGLTGEELQRAGQAYNQRIDNGYGGNFGQAIQNAENTVPQSPVYNTPAIQYAPEKAYIPEVNMREVQGEYTPFEPDYIPLEGTTEDIRKRGQVIAQNAFKNAQANRAGAAEFQRGYNPQGGHSTDPNLNYDFSSILPSFRRNTNID